jgi:calcium permeable stress-gated cation channel
MDPTRVVNLLVRDTAAAATPSPSTPAQLFLALVSNPFRTEIQSQAVLSALGLSLGLTAIIAILFSFLRPHNTLVYAPRTRYADEKHAPPALGKSPWAWVGPVIKTNEHFLVEKVGMDATIFIRFTAMLRNIFIVLTIVGCSVLIPIYILGTNQSLKNSGQSTAINVLVKLTPQNLPSKSFWGLVAVAWVTNLVICGFLFWNYRAVTRLRQFYFESQEYQNSLHARTLMITGIPKSLSSDEGLIRIVDEVKNTTEFPDGNIGRDVKGLPDLIEQHEETVRQLEEVLAKYFKNPDKLPLNRPTCKASKKDSEYKSGEKVDAIDYLTRRIQKLEDKIDHARANVDQRSAMNYGFVIYKNVEDAHAVAAAASKKGPKGASVRLAPRPSDIIWKNLPLSKKARKARGVTNNLWVILLTLIWIAPNALVAIFLSNLSNLGLLWSTFNTELHRHKNFWAVVQGVAAPAITSIVYLVLPKIFRRLSIKAGDMTKTARDKHVLSKLFAFFVFNNLIVFSVFGSIWQFAAAIIAAKQQNQDVLEAIKNGQIMKKIMIAMCNVSPYWSSYLVMRNLSAAVDLSQIINLAWGSFSRRFLSPTPRQVVEASAPPPFDYASYYNYFLFYGTVALGFSTIQPIVLPITALYFVLDVWLKKYLVLYVFTTKTESGGLFWRVLFNRIVFGVLFADIVIALLCYAQSGGVLIPGSDRSWIIMLISLAPLPFLLLAFKIVCSRMFDKKFYFYVPSRNEVEGATLPDNRTIRSDARRRFGHPALYKPLTTPLVHSRAQHLLSKVYNGRVDGDDTFDDTASLGGYSDMYSMQDLHHQHYRKASSQSNLKEAARRDRKAAKKGKKAGPFEFVSEADMRFENFMDRDDFRGEFGGEGELYGKAEDSLGSRPATPVNHIVHTPLGHARVPSRPGTSQAYMADRNATGSRDSERTFVAPHNPAGNGLQIHGYTPSSLRPYSPSPVRGQEGRQLLGGAAPMGSGMEGVSRSTTPLSEAGGYTQPPQNGYDYFRGRQM